MNTPAALEIIKRQVNSIKRLAESVDDYETSRSLFLHADRIAAEVEKAEAESARSGESPYPADVYGKNGAVELAVAYDAPMPRRAA